MKSNIALTDEEIYTAIIALSFYEVLASKNAEMDEKNKLLEMARASDLADKLKKMVHHKQ